MNKTWFPWNNRGPKTSSVPRNRANSRTVHQWCEKKYIQVTENWLFQVRKSLFKIISYENWLLWTKKKWKKESRGLLSLRLLIHLRVISKIHCFLYGQEKSQITSSIFQATRNIQPSFTFPLLILQSYDDVLWDILQLNTASEES